MITHDVLFPRESPDEVEERGPITSDQAFALFDSFPFERELEARRRNPRLMAPTITFTDNSSGTALAIWSENLGKFSIWLPSEVAWADNVPDVDAVKKCIRLFFDGQIEELGKMIADLNTSGQK